MERYAFFLDIDGTVYTGGTVCEKNRRAIAAAREKGHLVFINTARSLAIIPPEIASLGVDGFITSIGCSVSIGEKSIVSEVIPQKTVGEILDLFNEKGLGIKLEGETRIIINPFYPADGSLTVEDSADYLERFADEKVAKAYIPHVLPPEMQKYLGERFMFFQHPDYSEFAIRGFSKSTGIAAVLKETGIPVERCVGMGDSLNDADMLRFCGISAAMGDGAEEIKRMCTFVTRPAADGGVAEGIERVLNGEFSL